MASLKDTSVTGTLAVTGTITGTLSGTAQNANQLIGKNWSWSGQGGQPDWLWGGSDGTNMYVYNPANFTVNYANSSNVCNTLSNHQWASHGGNGYIRLSTGLIIQWGVTPASSSAVTIYFPISFPSTCVNVSLSIGYTSTDTGGVDSAHTASSLTKSTFRISQNTAYTYTYWMAIGY